MKKILIAFVIAMSTTAFAADGVAPAQGGSSNTDTTVVHKAKKKKKSKKKGKKEGLGSCSCRTRGSCRRSCWPVNSQPTGLPTVARRLQPGCPQGDPGFFFAPRGTCYNR